METEEVIVTGGAGVIIDTTAVYVLCDSVKTANEPPDGTTEAMETPEETGEITAV